MPLRDTEAFVLRSYTLKEADKIGVFFTRDAGKIRGVAHGARKLKSKYGASLEPFTEVSLHYFEQENRDLVSINNCEIIRSQFTDVISSERLAALHYLSELLLEFLPDHEPNETIYRLVGAALKALRLMPADDPGLLLRYCEVWILKLGGFFPDWKRCAECGRELLPQASVWLSADSAPLCSNCANQRGEELQAPVRMLVSDILRLPPEKFVAQTPDPRAVTKLESIVTKLIKNILERELKSYEMLERLKTVDGSW
jgi:DNA repair protein RecO (recombination protein O)